MKRCPSCKTEKDDSEYYLSISRKDGLYDTCKPCTRAYANQWATKNRDKRKQWRKRYWQCNRDKELAKSKEWRQRNIEHRKQYDKQYRAKNAMRVKEWSLAGQFRRMVKNYGINIEQYNLMLSHQGSTCFICGKINENGKRLSVDHNHNTKVVRKLLCQNCNILIGHCKENPDILESAKQYLIAHQ